MYCTVHPTPLTGRPLAWNHTSGCGSQPCLLSPRSILSTSPDGHRERRGRYCSEAYTVNAPCERQSNDVLLCQGAIHSPETKSFTLIEQSTGHGSGPTDRRTGIARDTVSVRDPTPYMWPTRSRPLLNQRWVLHTLVRPQKPNAWLTGTTCHILDSYLITIEPLSAMHP